MGGVHRITYVSSATRLLDDTGLIELLEQSRLNNARDAVTGLLLYHDGNFLQVIEGESAPVQSLLARILLDARHRRVIILEDGMNSSRNYAGWSMAFVPGAALNLARLTGFLHLGRVAREEDPPHPARGAPHNACVRAFLSSIRGLASPR